MPKTSIVINLSEWDFEKYREMWDWCKSYTRAAWEAPNFNPWQYEALLSHDKNIKASFDFHSEADAAMFKLMWFERRDD